jgi:hypothetical protein
MKKGRGSKRKSRKQEFKNIKETLAFKLLIIFIIILFVLLVIWAFVYEPEVDESREDGELGTFGPLGFDEGIMPFPQDCSDLELRAIWDFIFRESSSGSIILKNNSYTGLGCPEYYLYKIVGEEIWILEEFQFEVGDFFYSRYLLAYYVDANQELVDQFDSVDFENFNTTLFGIYVGDSYNLVKDRDIIDNVTAKTEFDNKFNSNNFMESEMIWNYDTNNGKYIYNLSEFGNLFEFNSTTEIEEIFLETKAGLVLQNKSVDSFLYFANDYPSLTQIDTLENILIYNEDSLTNILNLSEYFTCPYDIDYNIVGDLEDKLGLFINSSSNLINLDPKLDGYGSYVFELTAECDNEIFNISNKGEDMSFNVTFIDSDRPIPNHAPDFHSDGVDDDYSCDDLLWNRNTSYKLNMTECWDDEDDDTLKLRYTNSKNDNVTIKESKDVLTLTPDTNWIGSGYFYIYANDSKTEEGKRIDFNVRIPPNTNSSTTPNNTHPNIKTTSPTSSDVSIVDGNKTFSITAERYSTIKWYLNGALLSGSGLSLNINDLKNGDIVKVEIINGTRVDSKTWNIKVGESIPQSGTTSLGLEVNLGKVIFYMIVVVLIIIILLIIWIFISEKRNKNKKVHLGFGVVGGGVVGKKTSSDQFNIPNR